jgi:hypothetical protein
MHVWQYVERLAIAPAIQTATHTHFRGCRRMQTYADVCRRMHTRMPVCDTYCHTHTLRRIHMSSRQYLAVCLEDADVCRRMQTYADVCRRTLTYAAYADVCRRMQPYADVCRRTLTYADVRRRMSRGCDDPLQHS